MDDIAADDPDPPLSRFAPSHPPCADPNPPPVAPRDHAIHRLHSQRDVPTARNGRTAVSEPKGRNAVADNASPSPPPPAPPPLDTADAGEKNSPVASTTKLAWSARLKAGSFRFYHHTRDALFHSWLNVLLIFVPIGIAVQWAPLPTTSHATVVFSLNAIAIIPLAGLLAYATESVASRMGDTWASLLNVTFGNAVELIIFIIALAKDEIRITQASILGSILANLLLILGMSFLIGGLRFQEQIYNSTVTQMSACLLSLSVMSLLLPTAFHASFLNNDQADVTTTKISRGVSVVLLLVYGLYLLFQLKSHAYMYASTPQEVIDEESHPGVLADMLNSSSSDSDSSSSDSDSSLGSHFTAGKRFKRAVKKRIRRKSSTTESLSNVTTVSTLASPRSGLSSAHGDKYSLFDGTSVDHGPNYFDQTQEQHHAQGGIMDDEDPDLPTSPCRSDTEPRVRDFEVEKPGGSNSPPQHLSRQSTRKKPGRRYKREYPKPGSQGRAKAETKPVQKTLSGETIVKSTGPTSQPRVYFSDEVPEQNEDVDSARAGFARQISRTAFRTPGQFPLPRLLSNTVFTQRAPPRPAGPVPQHSLSLAHRPGPRRTRSLPDRLRRPAASARASSGNPAADGGAAEAQTMPGMADTAAQAQLVDSDTDGKRQEMSRTAAIVLLLVTTGLVAFCAELLVEAIPQMVSSTGVSQAFIGLIILPIVGNAAEHVTAVTVATKNKMDLAIGVAVGSSIQIALFITPVIVLLGWIMSKDMSLYFNLFETVSLFATAFVVNFLVLDGRSNYLEGSLLIAAYVIIAVAAFFYPPESEQSEVGGNMAQAVQTAGPHMAAQAAQLTRMLLRV